MQVATKYLDPIGSVVWTFKETDGQTDKQSIYIDQLPLEKRFPYFFRLQIIFQKLNIKYSKIFIFLTTCNTYFNKNVYFYKFLKKVEFVFTDEVFLSTSSSSGFHPLPLVPV